MKRSYRVFAWEPEAYNGADMLYDLGEYEAWTARAAANRALRDLARDPFDSGGAAMTGAGEVYAIPASQMVPQRVRIPKAVQEAWAAGESTDEWERKWGELIDR